jgi:preflagellin peptidase FlaK
MAAFGNADVLDAIRLAIGAVVLCYASYTDVKTRTAENYLWAIMGGAGVLLLALQFFLFPGTIAYFDLIFIPIMIGLVYLLYHLRLIFGGADAKALMAIAVLVPFWPKFTPLPSIMPFSLSVLTNALLVFILIPLGLFIYNVSHGDVKFPHAFLGVLMPIEKAQRKFVWPMQYLEKGRVKNRYFPTEGSASADLRLLRAYGLRKVWVTPKLPFMIPICAGFVLSFIAGDILFWIIASIMG